MPITMSPTSKTAIATQDGKKTAKMIGELTLAPGEDAKLPVGTFSETEAQPSFILTFSAGTSESIKASLVRLAADNGYYTLEYLFHSACKLPSNVLVQQVQV